MRKLALLANITFLLLVIPLLGLAEEGTLSAKSLAEGKKRFEANCGTCHSLDLPKSQRLNRANWEWVMDDMVNQYGATWLTAEDQKLILDYLVSTYGPDS
jgi:mono/diheme cytochrome c family protein